MAYLQVKGILENAVQLRKYLCDFCERQQIKASNDLLAGLFEEVNKHEAQLEECLAEYEEDTSQDLLDTWIQYPGDNELKEAIASLPEVSFHTDGKVLEKLILAEETLLRVYKQVQEQIGSERLQEIFDRLIELQDQHLRNVGNCVSEYSEMHRD